MPGTYRPAAAATLSLYLDDCLGTLPESALKALQGEPVMAPWIPGGTEWAARGGAGNDPSVLISNIVPKSTHIRRNPYREADEAELTMRLADFPLNPQLVRAASAAIRMGTIPHAMFGEYMRAGRSPVLNALFARQDNLRFVGFRDSQGNDFGPDGEWCRLEFRDVTKLLIDREMPASAWSLVTWGEYVERVILSVLETYNAVSGMVLDLVDIEPGTVKASPNQINTAGGNKPAMRSPSHERQTYWDALTELTVGMGLLLYSDVRQGPAMRDADGREVPTPPHRFVLTRPSAIYDTRPTLPVWHVTASRQSDGKLAYSVDGPYDTPQFVAKGRKDPRDPTGRSALTVPTVIYGHNLEELHFERRDGMVAVPSIELICHTGKYALRAKATGRPAVGHMGRSATEDVRVYTVTGYTDPAKLQAAAEQMVDEIGRGDVTMTFSTKDMATYGGDNSDPDALDLRAGSPISVLFARELADGTVSDRLAIEAMSESELRERLKARAGMEDQPAKALAQFLKDPRYSQRQMTTWYFKSGDLHLDEDLGFQASGEACNYFWQPKEDT